MATSFCPVSYKQYLKQEPRFELKNLELKLSCFYRAVLVFVKVSKIFKFANLLEQKQYYFNIIILILFSIIKSLLRHQYRFEKTEERESGGEVGSISVAVVDSKVKLFVVSFFLCLSQFLQKWISCDGRVFDREKVLISMFLIMGFIVSTSLFAGGRG